MAERRSSSARGALPRMRLHRYIASCGLTSRRRAELLIEAGRVTVNGRVVTHLGQIVNPARDRVAVNGEEISPPEPITIALNKPRGVITSTHDTHERLTVMDLLPRSLQLRGVLPVGRLDQDTEGLLVLTNDGDLSHRIAHPRYETEKEYRVLVEGEPSTEALRRLQEGVRIEGRRTASARILSVSRRGTRSRIDLVIHEGKKRQVRRMFEAIGHRVKELERTRIGSVRLGELERGAWRELSSEEIEGLTAPPR